MPDPAPRIALVGHCGPDARFIAASVRRFIPGAEIVPADSLAAAQSEADRADLLLINRVLDGDFPTDQGVGLLRDFAGRHAALMLISNYPEAQAEAAAAGAFPGFGKRDLYDVETKARLLAALANHAATTGAGGVPPPDARAAT